MKFDWDDGNRDHIALHDIGPEEAEQAIDDPHATSFAASKTDGETRYGLLGATIDDRVLVVIYTWRSELCRVVTAYPATPRQQRIYGFRSGR